jgi:hypothetical protein
MQRPGFDPVKVLGKSLFFGQFLEWRSRKGSARAGEM